MSAKNRRGVIHTNLCLFTVAGLPFLFALIVVKVYWPGLHGSFLFDDFANISKLGEFGGVNDLRSFLAFVLGGIAGPTGRPVSLLSFLLNDVYWPSEARSFLYVNLLFHALNGLLLTWVLYRLLRVVKGIRGESAALIAVVAASLWILHPLHVSTVLYPVQRMTELSALFTLQGLLCFVVGREKLKKRKPRAYLWMTMGIALFTPIAIISKENGVLLPVYAFILEATVIAHLWPKGPKLVLWWRILFFYLPIALILSYLVYIGFTGVISGDSGVRDFTVGERLLTEGRILVDYLVKLFLPRMQSGGLFTEFSISRSAVDPPSTLMSHVFVIGLIVGAVIFKRKAPTLSAAILFFFAGHLIESTVLMLELYFEHRNYVPSLLLFLPLAWFLLKGPLTAKYAIILCVLILGMFSFLTYQRAKLWGDPVALTFSWARESPFSVRAQRSAALKWGHLNRPDKAYEVLAKASKNIPDNLSLKLHLLFQKCIVVGVTQEEVDQAIFDALTIPEKLFDLKLMQWILTELAGEQCSDVDAKDVQKILINFRKNPGLTNNTNGRRLIYHIEGIVHLTEGEEKEAFAAFQKCYEVLPNLPTVMHQVGLLATYGYYQTALDHLRNAEKIEYRPGLRRKLSSLDYPAEIAIVKTQLEKEISDARLESRSPRPGSVSVE